MSERPLGQQEETSSRRRALLLALPPDGPNDFTPIEGLSRLNADIAAIYATRTPKTMTRDVNVLLQEGLVVINEEGTGIRPAFEQLFGTTRRRPV